MGSNRGLARIAVVGDVELRPVPGSDIYWAGSDGHIYSTARGPMQKMADFPSSSGHRTIGLYMGEKNQRRLSVHRVVASAFHGPCPDGLICCHNNGQPADNRPENLRWDTFSENAYDRVRHGRNYRAIGTLNPMAKLTEDDVRAIRKSSLSLNATAKLFGVSKKTILNIRHNRIWRHA